VADLLLLGFIGAGIWGGFRTGFIRRLAGLGFMALSFVAGAYLRGPAGALVGSFFPDIPPTYADMVGYSVAFTALVFAFNLVTRPILSKVAVQGVSAVMDRALGAVLGGVETVLIASAAIVILHTYGGPGSSIATITDLGFLRDLSAAIDASTIGQLLEKTTVPIVLILLGPLLPKDITTLVPTTIPGGVPGFPVP
jgi:uncharacterized membrane protein required for colicin V production